MGPLVIRYRHHLKLDSPDPVTSAGKARQSPPVGEPTSVLPHAVSAEIDQKRHALLIVRCHSRRLEKHPDHVDLDRIVVRKHDPFEDLTSRDPGTIEVRRIVHETDRDPGTVDL